MLCHFKVQAKPQYFRVNPTENIKSHENGTKWYRMLMKLWTYVGLDLYLVKCQVNEKNATSAYSTWQIYVDLSPLQLQLSRNATSAQPTSQLYISTVTSIYNVLYLQISGNSNTIYPTNCLFEKLYNTTPRRHTDQLHPQQQFTCFAWIWRAEPQDH